jgi:ATP-dependent DNA helicase DinG
MAGGGSDYDDAVVRARLAQAFGRLIRREGDRGTFVILSAAMPSRLLSAFPAGVPIQRVPLDEAIAHVAAAATVPPVILPEAVECERSTF